MVRAVSTGVLVAAAACAAILSPWASAGPAAPRQFSLTLEVANHVPGVPYDTSGQKPRPITGFRYLVNFDNTGDSSDSDPSRHPGVHPMESHSPVVEAGQATGSRTRLTLPEGRYLITVASTPSGASAVGHKAWGVHVRLPEDADTTKRVDLIPLPLPLGKLVVHVFEDSRPVNGVPDVSEIAGTDREPAGLDRFNVVVRDIAGAVVTRGLTGKDGTVVFPNLAPGKFRVSATPPAGAAWRQTTTFEGGSTLDARVIEGADGTGPTSEALPASLTLPTAHWFGFARRLDFAEPANPTSRGRAFSGRITGCVRNWVRWGPFDTPVLNDREPVAGGWVALSTAVSAEQAYAGPLTESPDCPGGKIDIGGVPPGAYTMFLWDEHLASVARQVRVYVPGGPAGSGEAIRMPGDDGQGNVGMFRFFGWLSGRVYNDLNSNGVRDLAPAENGIPGVNIEIRARDGSLEQAAVTDAAGFYEFPKALSRLNKFEVAEVSLGRSSATGPSLYSEYTQNQPGDRGTAIASRLGDGLVTAQLTTEGHRSTVDWGRRPAGPGGAGEIAGIVHYATTRREADPRFARAESYEPGVPGVVVKLWVVGPDGRPGTADDVLVDNYLDGRGTDRWEHPSGCDLLDSTGAPVVPGPTLPVGPDCLEFGVLGNETKDGTFDGGYGFTDICPPPDGWPCSDADRILLPAGDYVVGVQVPDGYEIVKEEDVNASTTPAAERASAPCVGDPHVVPSTGSSPFRGQTRPLCDKRHVTVSAGQRASADFFVFTQVPAPGRVFGLLGDDLDVEADSTSPRYGEPRSLPNVPVGIRDYSHRLLTTVTTDELGFYETLLPSAQTTECKAASGICTAAYLFVFNDPGDPGKPNANFNPRYSTETRPVDVLAGTTTRLSTRLGPIAGEPCAPYDGPEFFAIDKVAIARAGTQAERHVTIRGVGFGDERVNAGFPEQPGGVVLVSAGGVRRELPADAYESWSSGEIKITIPQSIGEAPLSPGPYQLLVQAPASAPGQVASTTAPTGITLHWLGSGYNPPRRYVDGRSGSDSNPGRENAPFKTIQRALDAAPSGSLILVKPAVYRENVVVYRRAKLQGFGPGGLNGARFTLRPDEDPRRRVPGTVINAAFFNSDHALRARWYATISKLQKAGFVGHPDPADKSVPRGAAITLVARAGSFTGGRAHALIDGFAVHSARTDARGVGGGGIVANGFVQHLQVRNNLIAGNHGEIGGGIVLGQPYRGTGGNADNANDTVTIAYNRVVGNGGSKFAGAVGIFNGADRYTFSNNNVCSNVSARRGAGLSHYGLSNDGRIVENRFASNHAADGGGAVAIQGQSPVHGAKREGTGGVDLARNVFLNNQAEGDGGAIELVDALTFRIGIRNNVVANNNAAGSGGGLALADSSNVRILNNTIARNTSTATCWGCLGSGLHAGGLASRANSPAFQGTLPASAPSFSSPLLLNNIFWQNEAFTFDLAALPAAQAGPPLVSHSFADFEIVGGPELRFRPKFSLLSALYDGADATDAFFGRGEDPFGMVLDSTFAAGFNTKSGDIVVRLLPASGGAPDASILRVYHLCDPVAPGAACFGDAAPTDSGEGGIVPPPGTIVPAVETPIFAPSIDVEGDVRPFDGNDDGAAAVDIGADELVPGGRIRR